MTDVNTLFQKASKLHQKGRFQDAERLYTKILKVAPRFPAALNMYGVLQLQLRKFTVAIEYFNQTIKLEPNNAPAHENLARSYMGIKQFAHAQSCYEAALRLKPRSFTALFGLGGALISQHKFVDALQAFIKAQALNKTNPMLYLNLGNVFRRLGRIDEAILNYKKASSLDPRSVDAHACLGQLYLQQADFQSAEEHFRKAIELGAQRPDIEIGLAETLEKNGKEEHSAKHYYNAVEQDPLSQNAYIRLDEFLLRSGGARKKSFLKELASDHIYTHWSEAVADARKLAAMYRYPNGDILSTLHQFLAHYEPEKPYPPSWWREQLVRFGDPRKGHDKVLRSVHSAIFSWSLPDSNTLSQIAEFIGDTRLSSFGSGSGFWERLLMEHFGKEVVATDYTLRHRFLPMAQGDYSRAVVPKGNTIFLSWIVRGDTGILNVLKQMHKKQQLVLIGEPPDKEGVPRICGTPEMFSLLEKEFSLKKCIPLVSYSLLNDTASLYIKQ